MKTAKEILSKYFAQTTVPQPSMVLVEKAMTEFAQAYHEDKTRWVECSERLPEMGYIVSTYSKYYGVNNAVWIQKGVWKSNVNNQEYQGVTHWQPLPTPPKINAE